jgi:tRNA (guanine-N7-)-methyltransferase
VPEDLVTESRRRYADAPRLPDQGVLQIADLLPIRVDRIELEIGPGRGPLRAVGGGPDIGMIAFEVSRKWTPSAQYAWLASGSRPRARSSPRALAWRFPARAGGAKSPAYFHFPDPWWKKRHRKRLVVGSGVLDEVARLLAPHGELFVQTDVEERADLYETQILGHAAFEAYGEPGPAAGRPSPRLAENPYRARSHRERRAIDDAIPIYRLRFRRSP